MTNKDIVPNPIGTPTFLLIDPSRLDGKRMWRYSHLMSCVVQEMFIVKFHIFYIDVPKPNMRDKSHFFNGFQTIISFFIPLQFALPFAIGASKDTTSTIGNITISSCTNAK